MTELFAFANTSPLASCKRMGLVEITSTINVTAMTQRQGAEEVNPFSRFLGDSTWVGYISLSMSFDVGRQSLEEPPAIAPDVSRLLFFSDLPSQVGSVIIFQISFHRSSSQKPDRVWKIIRPFNTASSKSCSSPCCAAVNTTMNKVIVLRRFWTESGITSFGPAGKLAKGWSLAILCNKTEDSDSTASIYLNEILRGLEGNEGTLYGQTGKTG